MLTLNVRLNRPNYPTFIDFHGEAGVRASTSSNLTYWTEIQHPSIDASFTLAGRVLANGVVISGQAKVPFVGISDIPGPVTLLGLVSTDEGRGPKQITELSRCTGQHARGDRQNWARQLATLS